MLTIDGATGQVIKGVVEMRQPELSGEFTILMDWADAVRRMACGPMPTRRGTHAWRGNSGGRDRPLPYEHMFLRATGSLRCGK